VKLYVIFFNESTLFEKKILTNLLICSKLREIPVSRFYEAFKFVRELTK